METSPRIAVVIPTRDRETRVAFALEALSHQTLAKDRFEVLVVRDATQKGPLATAPQGLRVRYLTHPVASGPTAKRNIGWRATSADLIAFTDDDCRPAPDWLERLLAAHDEATYLQGRTEVDPAEAHLLRGLARTRIVIGPSEWYPACNVAYPRSLLEHVDGFDESFYFGGEDTDLALRAKAAGASARYVDAALVWHAVHSRNVVSAARDAFAWPSLPLLVARHPEHRKHLYLSTFRNKSHALLALAALGAMAFRRRPALAMAALAPYAHHQLGPQLAIRRTPRTSLRIVLRFPVQMLADVLEVAGTCRAAIAHRVLVA